MGRVISDKSTRLSYIGHLYSPFSKYSIALARHKSLLSDAFIKKTFVPFDPQNRRTEAIVQKDGDEFKVMKGSVRVIAGACGFDEDSIKKLEKQLQEFAAKGFRALAVAKADIEGQPQLVGVAALYDMPRPDSEQLIKELKDLGVSVKMPTGDSLPIAREIARDVGLGENVISASSLKLLIKSNPIEATDAAETSSGFAEVYPEDKYAIVKSFQAEKRIVGMTGDGINDAPALKRAEVGIAVSNATDVAKGAASVVLTGEGLTGIVDLVKNGRVIYERITAWILSKIVRTLQISMFVVLSFLFTGTYVVSAFAIILYFFLTDFVKIALSTDNLCWSKKPDTWDITGTVKSSLVLGFLVIAESFGLLYIAINFFNVSLNDPALYTFTFEVLFFSAMFLIFNVRERHRFWFSRPSKTLIAAIIISIAAGTVLVTVGIPGLKPVPLTQTLFVILFSATFSLIINDSVKSLLVEKGKVNW